MTNPNQLCDVLLFVCSKMADEPGISYMKMTMILADSVCVEDVLCGQNYYLSFSLAFSTRLHVPAPKTRISLLFYTV